jgi:hypothetical protein
MEPTMDKSMIEVGLLYVGTGEKYRTTDYEQ